MTTCPAIPTLATATTDVSTLVAVLSVCVALAGIILAIVNRLRDKADRERELRANERHGEIVVKIDDTRTTVRQFRTEVTREFAALHRADAAIQLDLERRVAPIEGRLGIGRMADRDSGGRTDG